MSTWLTCSEILQVHLSDFESVAKWWLCRKKHTITNMCTTAIIWSIWKLRNSLCFQGGVYSDVKVVLIRAAGMLRRWKVLCKEAESTRLEEVVVALEQKAKESARIGWLPASLGTQGMTMTRVTSSSTFGALPASLGGAGDGPSDFINFINFWSSETTHMSVLPAMLNL